MERADHPATTGSTGTDRDVQNEQSLHDRLKDLQRELELEKAKTEAINGLMAGYRDTATPPQSTTRRSTLDLIGSIPWDKSKAFLAFFAIILFGAVRFANGAFYARLGLTPEDVGLNSAIILARSAMSVILLVASLILLGFLAYAVQRKSSLGLQLLGIPMAYLGLILFRTLFPLPDLVTTTRDNYIYNAVIFSGGSFLASIFRESRGEESGGRVRVGLEG
jgi:hypothetical protein